MIRCYWREVTPRREYLGARAWTRTFVQEPGKNSSGFFVGIDNEVGVDIEGGGCVAVAEPTCDCAHVHPGSQQARGDVMPKPENTA